MLLTKEESTLENIIRVSIMPFSVLTRLVIRSPMRLAMPLASRVPPMMSIAAQSRHPLFVSPPTISWGVSTPVKYSANGTNSAVAV